MNLQSYTNLLKSAYTLNAITFILLLVTLTGITTVAQSQNDIKATPSEKRFLLPLMTVNERDGVISPVEGMMIYNMNDKKPQFYNGIGWKNFDVNNHFIGERFAGGIIFFIDSTGEHGLVVAPADQKSANWGFFENQVGAHGKTIGAGKSNTEIITKAHPKPDIAASICSEMELNGYSDWFLPSLEELSMIYHNIKTKGLGNFSNEEYWSSSETDFNNAWMMNFSTAYPVENNVDRVLRVRAVRYF